MALPGVTININNDRLGQTNQTVDTVAGLILTGATVAGAGNVTVGQAYKLNSLQDAENIGIAATGTNTYAHRHIKEFYDQAKTGAELWIMLVTAAVLMSEMLDKDGTYAPALLTASGGRVRNLGVSRQASGVPTIANGVDEDVDASVTAAQALAVAQVAAFKPLRVVVDGKDWNGNSGDLKDYKTASSNRVLILLGATVSTKNAAVGLFLGRVAANPVMRNPGRVKDGDLLINAAYFTDGSTAITYESAWPGIHDKGYVFLRTIPGKSGFFFSDAPTLTANSDDLNSLPRVQVIDKASQIAFSVFTENILDEIPLAESGKISPSVIGNWKADIEAAINTQMTANGEISGCKATIDPNQDILATNTLEVSLDILPVGYSSNITVNLGFTTSLTE